MTSRKVLPEIWLRQIGPPRYFTEVERSSQTYDKQKGPPRNMTEAERSSQIYDWGRKVFPDIWLRQKLRKVLPCIWPRQIGPLRYMTEAERSSQVFYWGRKVLPDIWLRQIGPPRYMTVHSRKVLPGIWLKQKGLGWRTSVGRGEIGRFCFCHSCAFVLHDWWRISFPTCQEMDTEYRYAVRKAILDYILLDPTEQERLGMPMPEKVSAVVEVKVKVSLNSSVSVIVHSNGWFVRKCLICFHRFCFTGSRLFTVMAIILVKKPNCSFVYGNWFIFCILPLPYSSIRKAYDVIE